MSYQPYIILASARSGSNLLVHLLHDHPQVRSYGEPFQKEFLMGNPGATLFETRAGDWLYRHLRARIPVWLIQHLIFRSYPVTVTAVGFKLLYSHAQSGREKAIWRYLQQLPDLKIINLERQNKFHAYVSLAVANQTKQFIVLPGQKKKASRRLKLSTEECRVYFEEVEGRHQKYADFFAATPTLNLTYEQLVTDQTKVMKKVQQFLGLPVRSLTCGLRKQNDRPMRNIVTNYDQLKAAFAKTRWKTFFDE